MSYEKNVDEMFDELSNNPVYLQAKINALQGEIDWYKLKSSQDKTITDNIPNLDYMINIINHKDICYPVRLEYRTTKFNMFEYHPLDRDALVSLVEKIFDEGEVMHLLCSYIVKT